MSAINRDMTHVNINLQRKIAAILADLLPLLPAGWTLNVFETLRTVARQKLLVAQGFSKTMHSKHIIGQAVDLVWQHNGQWTWTAPRMTDGRNGWQALTSAKKAHNLRIIKWDLVHMELKPEDA